MVNWVHKRPLLICSNARLLVLSVVIQISLVLQPIDVVIVDDFFFWF